jgi:putative FmdB family regulatory protein
MPTYEYVCEKCGDEFEYLQSMTAEPLKTCPKELCHQKKWGRGRVKKKISGGAGLLFKGSGFYITDYRSENYKKSAQKADGDAKPAPKAESKAEGKAESKTESKPAPKAEAKPAAAANKNKPASR